MKKLRISVDGRTYDVDVEILDEGKTSPASRGSKSGGGSRVSVPAPAAAPKVSSAGGGNGDVTSPLGAVVVSIDVALGDAVEEGQKVITLEAMKMNTVVTAPKAGKVSAIHVQPGDGVEEGQKMLTLS